MSAIVVTLFLFIMLFVVVIALYREITARLKPSSSPAPPKVVVEKESI